MHAALDVHLLARTHVLVGKFTSSLFRAAYALAAGQRGALLPFISLDAPWCSDFGVQSGYNDNFPGRHANKMFGSHEEVVPFPMEYDSGNRALKVNGLPSVFLC